jgi:hypothetical protein
MKYFIFFILLFLLSNKNCYAQKKLTESDLLAFKDRARIAVKHLQDYISMLASASKDSTTKNYYKSEALKLFKNNGTDVTMEVSSLRNSQESRARLPLLRYFNGIISLTKKNGKYAQVEITFAETWHVSNLHKIDENKYHATATIFQKFVGYDTEGNAKYQDITKKTIEIDVEKVADFFGERWIVLLGDISVTETSR